MDIKIQNLKKIYNGNTVLDIDNLGVAKGELIGLVGTPVPWHWHEELELLIASEGEEYG